MGGPERRVYWPPTMEEWLRPVKRVVKKKESGDVDEKETTTKKRKVTVKEEAVLTASVKKTKKAAPRNGVSSRKATSKAIEAPEDMEDDLSEDLPDLSDASGPVPSTRTAPVRQSSRAKKVNYAEDD